ncbi:MAG: TIGR01906 family membrane protein [Clostridiales bacterium]|nr:TIGR01906 family membrane protein [Clostridiales bacterium]
MNTKRILTFVCALALIIMLLLNAVAVVVFGDMDYFRSEFEKYNVTENIDMEMNDIMYVMDELMDYLHGDREDLENIVTEVNGETRDFFSEREKTHMADCKVLFDGGFAIRTGAAVVFASTALILAFMKKLDLRSLIKTADVVSGVITCAAAVLGVAAMIDFDACFVIFHKLFFNNDLWLLDPAEDLVINILVEEFFADMALKIAVYCVIILVVFIVFGAAMHISDKKRRQV